METAPDSTSKTWGNMDRTTVYDSALTCPWCGHTDIEGWNKPEEFLVCNTCGKRFELTKRMELTYITTKAGVCLVCSQPAKIRKGGTLFSHGRNVEINGELVRRECDGSHTTQYKE